MIFENFSFLTDFEGIVQLIIVQDKSSYVVEVKIEEIDWPMSKVQCRFNRSDEAICLFGLQISKTFGDSTTPYNCARQN